MGTAVSGGGKITAIITPVSRVKGTVYENVVVTALEYTPLIYTPETYKLSAIQQHMCLENIATETFKPVE